MLRFIIHSYVFPRLIIIGIFIIICLFVSSAVFDYFWKNDCAVLLENMGDVYSPPVGYDNITKIRMYLIKNNSMIIEGNRRFKLKGNPRDFSYFDTVGYKEPDSSYEYLNKIFLQFENSPTLDSIYFVISKSPVENIFWHQIFYSSVAISELNKSEIDTANF